MIHIEILENVPLTDHSKRNVINFLNKYKPGYYLYPAVLARNTSEPIEICRMIIEALLKNELVDEAHYYMCGKCSSTSEIFDKDDEIDVLYCERCDESIDTTNYFLAFKFK